MLRVNYASEGACYFNVKQRSHLSAVMLSQAYYLFRDASIIKCLIKLKNTHRKSGKSRLIQLHNISSKMDMPILDAIKIGTAFEIILKSELLRRGYVIHILNDSLEYKKQRMSPIKIQDIKKKENLINKRSNNFEIKGLSHKTINFSLILDNVNYQKVMSYPSHLYAILKGINETRNSLHFIPVFGRVFTGQSLDQYEYLKNFINKKIVKNHNRIMYKLGLTFQLSPIK